jgi:hypothetical protein
MKLVCPALEGYVHNPSSGVPVLRRECRSQHLDFFDGIFDRFGLARCPDDAVPGVTAEIRFGSATWEVRGSLGVPAETGSGGDQPGRGIVCRNSSADDEKGRESSRHVLGPWLGADRWEAVWF